MRVIDIINENIIDEINIDNNKGIGATPNNRDIDYKGLRVLMRPKTFIRLAAPLNRQDATSIDFIKNKIESGEGIASPYLTIEIPEQWKDGSIEVPAKVIGHDGRNRMWAVEEEEGNDPIEVHLFFYNMKASDIKPEWIERLKKGMIMQGSSGVESKGPLFKMGHDAGELDEVYPGQSSGKLKNWVKQHYGGSINCTKAAKLKNDSAASTFYKKRASWYQSLHCKGNRNIR